MIPLRFFASFSTSGEILAYFSSEKMLKSASVLFVALSSLSLQYQDEYDGNRWAVRKEKPEQEQEQEQYGVLVMRSAAPSEVAKVNLHVSLQLSYCSDVAIWH